MAPALYGYPASPPVRGSLMTIEALGLEVEFKEINPLSPDLLKPEFLKLNPLHTIPTYQEGDFAIWNSHVINAYLVGKYGKNDSLYPKDLQKRAVVDQRMYFDDGVLFNKLKSLAFPMASGKTKTADPDAVAELENDMTPILYGPFASPPVRASVMTVQALGIDVKFHHVNTLAGDHLKPEFLQLNPLHTVPTLQDGDFVLWESHAINAYLVGKYGKDDSLYPKDLQKRAVVDQRMYFDTEILFHRFKANAALVIWKNVKLNKDMIVDIEDVSALGIQVDFIEVNILKGEQHSQDFLEMNPFHTVPTIQDDDFTIFDSHAINCYLVDKYSEEDQLYPKDLQKRAVVNQRLYFDTGILFPRLGAIIAPILRKGAKTVRKDLADSLVDAYNSLETLLERSTYVAGEHLTIADFSIVTTLTTANILVPIASNRFPKISEWLVKMQALPYYASANQVGLDQFAALIKSKLA